MAEATNTLSSKALERIRRHRAAVVTLAMMRAKQAIRAQIRAKGLKLGQVSAKEIAVWAEAEFERNRARLMAEAEEAINRWPGFERWRLPVANISSDAQRSWHCSSNEISVQNSGAERKAAQ